jgi:transcriptional regulator with XRE-family HTH domain
MTALRTRDERETASRRQRVVGDVGRGVAGLGAKLKAAREAKGISLRGLARSVNVSPSLVSQIERGLAMPSVGTLYAVVTTLDLGLDELFEKRRKKSNGGLAVEKTEPRNSPVRRSKNREAIRLADGVRWELLTPNPDPDLEFLYVVYEAGAESCAPDLLVRHGGMEYAYLISGRLGLRVGFDEYELKAGDSLSFDAQMPHRLWTIGSRPAVAIWAVLNRYGDRRAREAGGETAPRAKKQRAAVKRVRNA